MPTIECLLCHAVKPEEEFSLTKSGKNRRVICKDCEAKDKEEVKRKRREPEQWDVYKDRMLRQWHNITLTDYNILFDRQGGVCAICKKPETQRSSKNGRVFMLHVDHDHITGQIRGLLCHSCNVGIGAFRDDGEIMLAAIDYLQSAIKQRKIVQLAMFAD